MRIRNPFTSRVQLTLVSADVWGSIGVLNAHAVAVRDIRAQDALTVEMELRPRDYEKAKKLLEKRGDQLQVQRETGFRHFGQRILHRPVLATGLAALAALFLFLPTRILFVQVEGNSAVPARRILEAAEAGGIQLGASRRAVRSEKVKNALLSAVPELQWAGINTYGCRAVISVKERTTAQANNQTERVVSSMVAAHDGVIRSVTVEQGTVLCREGQAVRAGQILISGYTDCGFCIRSTRADGEVYAETIRSQTCVMPDSCQVRGEKTGTEKRYSLIIGKKRINLWKDSGIWDSSCGRISVQYCVTLPGGFSLPIALCCDVTTYYGETEQVVEREAAQKTLEEFSRRYLAKQMIAGTISDFRGTLENLPGSYRLRGEYHCLEMIGREHLETGVPHEQND